VPQVYEAIAVAMWQRLEENAAHHAEDRSVGADREAKRQYDGDREPAGAGEGAEGVFHIVQHGLHTRGAMGVAVD
jgi:hypothetical protein